MVVADAGDLLLVRGRCRLRLSVHRVSLGLYLADSVAWSSQTGLRGVGYDRAGKSVG